MDLAKIGETVKGNKWGVGGVLVGVGLLVLTSQIPHDTPGLQEFAGGAGLAALAVGAAALGRAIVSRFLKDAGPKA